MNPVTGEILKFENEEELKKELKRVRKSLKELKDFVPLTDKQEKTLKKMEPRKRINKMRNLPCPCGSGKKLKKCCISKYVERNNNVKSR